MINDHHMIKNCLPNSKIYDVLWAVINFLLNFKLGQLTCVKFTFCVVNLTHIGWLTTSQPKMAKKVTYVTSVGW